MHVHLSLLAAEDEDYRNYHAYIQQKLINYLLCYSGHLASIDANQRYAAERALMKALQYDPANPVAAYRLASLFHQQHLHAEALCLLQRALDSQPEYLESAYKLNAEQIKRALLFMSSCSLHIGSRAFAASSAVPSIQGAADFSDLFAELQYSDSELRNSAYRIRSAGQENLCSRQHCVDAIAQNPKDTIILFFNSEGPELIYNGITEKLAPVHAYMLRHLLLSSCPSQPMTPLDVKEFFLDTHVMTGVTGPTFNHAIEGLLQAFREIEIPSAINRTEVRNQPACYFSGSSKYLVIGRVDEELNFK
jgi:tetratricopeptide (TPR) repeat protein